MTKGNKVAIRQVAPISPFESRLVQFPSSKSRIMSLEHGVIGNGCLIALVHPDTGFDWLCMPRFDSPSIFGRILDEDRGGTWRFTSNGKPVKGKTSYVRNTNVLFTRFDDGENAWELFDFMPRVPDGLRCKTPLQVIRLLRPVRGAPRLAVDFDPRPNYGLVKPRIIPGQHCISFESELHSYKLFSNIPAPYVINGQPFTLDRERYFVLTCGSDPAPQHLDEVHRELDLTIAGWRQWVQQSSTPQFADDLVLRSALCLKLHSYSETGAIIAAATTSIPEAIGEPRTWDYRYCWLRDSVFTVEALRRLAHFQEGRNFMQFVMDVAESGPLQPLYGIGGERDLPEIELEHLAGYKGTKPVRVGNEAASQLQTDLMGEVILCLRTMLIDERTDFATPQTWFPLIQRLVKESIESFDTPDLGIWEYREGPMLHTFSRAMCWAAVHHGAALATHFGHDDIAKDWQSIADGMRERVLTEGYNDELGMFTQTLNGTQADAAILLLPSIGLVEATDPRFLSTLDNYKEILVRGNGVMRYVHEDDFGSPSSTFTICSFWWVEALALAGRLEEAIEMFHKVSSQSNPLGLFSEDVDVKTGELLGNFPQAYTHVGLINAAMTIGTVLQARNGRFHGWAA
ncbi:MAG: GH15 family glucan-1,4-alpha-glucosidase [Planctomycetota bacterium]|jgi:GH15 family glucan-1,4-alpha-glucosidase